ncbi:MAG: hypothetical protein R3C49_11830 [Planctomycetaceae bacterium]
MNSEVLPDEVGSGRGRMWSLVVCSLLFVAVFVATYRYVFPRFGQEPLSSTSSLAFHAVAAADVSGAREIVLPDGTSRLISRESVLNAGDFSAFRSQDSSAGPGVVLLLNETGIADLEALTRRDRRGHLVATIHDRAVGEVAIDQIRDDRVVLAFRGMQPDDVNEVFARLTE